MLFAIIAIILLVVAAVCLAPVLFVGLYFNVGNAPSPVKEAPAMRFTFPSGKEVTDKYHLHSKTCGFGYMDARFDIKTGKSYMPPQDYIDACKEIELLSAKNAR